MCTSASMVADQVVVAVMRDSDLAIPRPASRNDGELHSLWYVAVVSDPAVVVGWLVSETLVSILRTHTDIFKQAEE